MKWMMRSVVPAAGLSCICCVGWVEPLIAPHHHWIYHARDAYTSIFLPIALDMILLWALFGLLLYGATLSSRMRVLVWCGVILYLPWLLLRGIPIPGVWNLSQRPGVALLAASGLCWIGLLALWRRSFLPSFVRLQRFTSSMLGVAALCGVLVAGQLLWCFWVARAMPPSQALHSSLVEPRSTASGERPHVIWIILDELSYQQVYERRFPSLDLPSFDRLASQSTVFTHVAPAAASTEAAVPSLITGLNVDRIGARADGTLKLMHDPLSGRWQPFHEQDTVFQDAISHGFRTGIAGWYNPYCRILSDVLDGCRWVFREEYNGGMFSDASIRSNLVGSWRYLLASVAVRASEHTEASQSTAQAKAHLADYQDLVLAGDQFLRDASIDFLLLHLPVPHPGGIYDRRTKTFTTHRSSYIDNLALADSYLGHVRQVLEARGEWDSSAIVVMGDHSWRTKLLWRGSSVWTGEDEVASHGGQFDDRPAYIVKLPGQVEGARIETPYAAARTRALLDGILDGSIRSEAELAAFAGSAAAPAARPEVVATRAGGGGLRSRVQ